MLPILPKLAILLLAITISTGYCQQKFPKEALPGVSVTANLDLDNMEFSGIVWQRQLQQFFMVTDGGIIVTTDPNYDLISIWEIDADLEGVTVVPNRTDYIYLGDENPDSILEFKISTGRITRRFDLTDWMDGPANSGLEALTFVPDESSPQGGLFYAGLQSSGDIHIFELPIFSSASSTSVNHIGIIESVTDNISGLNYCISQQQLYAIYDGDDLMVSLQPDGTITGTWHLPGTSQEGIAIKGTELYITEDYGSSKGDIMLYQPITLHPQPDMNCDGYVNLPDFAILAKKWLQATSDPANLDISELESFSSAWLK